jgi:DNA polymerase III alpha subunit (gram-positive type)
MKVNGLKDFVFIDIETTGLDPARDHMIEIAITRCHPWVDLPEKDSLYALILPPEDHDPGPEALAVNGYSRGLWIERGARRLDYETVCAISDHTAGAVPAGHNVEFDLGFLSAAFARYGARPLWDYHRLDTMHLGWQKVLKGEVESMKLAHLAAWAGVDVSNLHSARADVAASIAVARKLLA